MAKLGDMLAQPEPLELLVRLRAMYAKDREAKHINNMYADNRSGDLASIVECLTQRMDMYNSTFPTVFAIHRHIEKKGYVTNGQREALHNLFSNGIIAEYRLK